MTVISRITIKCRACNGTGTHVVADPESLKQARVKAGISLRQLADKLGFTAPYLSDIERGRRACTFIIESAYNELKPKKKENGK